MARLVERLRQALKAGTQVTPSALGLKLPTVTSLREKKEAIRILSEHTVQLSRIDAEVDAYRAALEGNRLRRRVGDRK